MSLIDGRCDRCLKPVRALRMSMFDTDMCCQACLTKEKQHPQYKEACDAVHAAEKQGDMNFKGIGKPEDL